MIKNKLIQHFFTRSVFTFLIVVYAFSVAAQKPQTSIQTDYCHFKGTINGNLPIIMDLIQNENTYSGSYYYTKYNSPINLEGKVNNKGEIELFVMNDEGEKIEFITGRINKNTFIGNWKNKDKSKILAVSLTEDYSKSISFNIIALKDSTKLIKNKKQSPQAIFSEVLLEVNQVPQGSNLAKIKELVQKKQNLTSSKTAKQVVEKNKNDYFKEYLEANKEFDQEYAYMANWERQSNVNVLFNDNYFVTLAFSVYQYSGGAHGGYSENFLIIDTKNGKEVKLNDIFDKTSLSTLQKRILKKAYAYTNSENATSLEDAGYLVDKIDVTENISLNSRGITFVYQQYEIAPYAAGMPAFFFTWEEIKDIIKTDSPVNELIKK